MLIQIELILKIRKAEVFMKKIALFFFMVVSGVLPSNAESVTTREASLASLRETYRELLAANDQRIGELQELFKQQDAIGGYSREEYVVFAQEHEALQKALQQQVSALADDALIQDLVMALWRNKPAQLEFTNPLHAAYCERLAAVVDMCVASPGLFSNRLAFSCVRLHVLAAEAFYAVDPYTRRSDHVGERARQNCLSLEKLASVHVANYMRARCMEYLDRLDPMNTFLKNVQDILFFVSSNVLY
jgi:cell division protein FtsB